MNLDNLRPAWRQFRLLNSIQTMNQHDILLIIEQAEDVGMSKLHRYVISSIVFTVLVICFQGG